MYGFAFAQGYNGWWMGWSEWGLITLDRSVERLVGWLAGWMVADWLAGKDYIEQDIEEEEEECILDFPWQRIFTFRLGHTQEAEI